MRSSPQRPSTQAALHYLETGQMSGIVQTTLLRAALIGTGAFVAGVRNPATLMKASIGGAIAVEVGVLSWIQKCLLDAPALKRGM